MIENSSRPWRGRSGRRPGAGGRPVPAGSCRVKSQPSEVSRNASQSIVSVPLVHRQASPSSGSRVPAASPSRAAAWAGGSWRVATAAYTGARSCSWLVTNAAASSTGQLARRHPDPGRLGVLDPVGAERAPVVPLVVVADQVPPAPGHHQPVRLDQPLGRDAVLVAVVEVDPLVAGGGGRQRGELLRVDERGLGRRGRGGQHADPLPQPGRQHLLELGQRAHRARRRCRPPAGGRWCAARPRSPRPRRRRAAGAAWRHPRRAGSRRRRPSWPRPGSPARAAARCRGARCAWLTPSRSAISLPGHSRGIWSRDNRRSSRPGVSVTALIMPYQLGPWLT